MKIVGEFTFFSIFTFSSFLCITANCCFIFLWTKLFFSFNGNTIIYIFLLFFYRLSFYRFGFDNIGLNFRSDIFLLLNRHLFLRNYFFFLNWKNNFFFVCLFNLNWFFASSKFLNEQNIVFFQSRNLLFQVLIFFFQRLDLLS